MGPTRASDPHTELPWGQPTTPRERRRAAVYIGTAATIATLVILAVVFDQIAATGLLLVTFLSFVLAYLLGPAVERIRRAAAPSRHGRLLSRDLATLALYGAIGALVVPLWTFTGPRIDAALGRMAVLVPEHTLRFVAQVHATDDWHHVLDLPEPVHASLGAATRRVTSGVEAEARALGAELVHVRRLLPWLSLVPVLAFVLLTRWRGFRRSTTRVLPTPHLQWRGDEFLQNLNTLLAAYTRAQIVSALIVAALCWIGFAALRLPYPGTLALAAGLLEMIPVAGPLVMAVVATAMAPERAVAVLFFLAALRLVQDYGVYPRLISGALHLHPLAVVLALWIGAVVGGIVGVCLAVPLVGGVQVARRHWREYRDIETLVAEVTAQRAAAGAVPPQPGAPARSAD